VNNKEIIQVQSKSKLTIHNALHAIDQLMWFIQNSKTHTQSSLLRTSHIMLDVIEH